MTRAIIALPAPAADRVSAILAREGVVLTAVCDPHALRFDGRALEGVDVLVLAISRSVLTPDLVAACDRSGVRIIGVTLAPAGSAEEAAVERLAASFGLEPAVRGDDGWAVLDAVHGGGAAAGRATDRNSATWTVPPEWTAGVPERKPAEAEAPSVGQPLRTMDALETGAPDRGAVIVVWGAGGAPGRSTVAALLASELARGGRHVALVDADAHAPSLALALGLADEGPGFAAACRQVAQGALDARELTRISQPLAHADGAIDVLCGLNRPGRWPELAEDRVVAALDACRGWADYTVVDVAAPLERDEELMSDLEGPRRNAATIAALRAADMVVAVCAADPLGVSRFLRSHAELRAAVGHTPVVVAANRLRAGGLGLDARGQVRRALERFAGIADVAFLPLDAAATDAAMLQARPVAEVAPRSPLVAAVRRMVGEALLPALRVNAASVATPPSAAPDRATGPVVLRPTVHGRGRRVARVGRARRTA